MLDVLRRNASSWVVQVLLGIIALVFIFFMGGGATIGRSISAVAHVGDIPISLTEWQQAERRNMQLYREQYGDRLTPQLLQALDVPGMSLSQLVDSAVLRNEATTMGLRVPDEAVASEIREVPAFQRDGQFSPDTYRALVQRQGMSAASFESDLRKDMMVEQLVDIVRRGAHVTAAEAREEYQRDNEMVSLEYVKVAAADVADDVEVTEDGLASYYEENKENHRIDEAVRIRYLAYTTDHFSDPGSVTGEEIEEYYVLNEETEFTSEETISARHILKRVDVGADDDAKAEARAAIDKIAERLAAGEDFEEIAKEESDDKGSGAAGGDLGSFSRGRMVKQFEEAAFELEVGKTSGVVETSFGYHIIMVYGHADAGTRQLEDVRDEIAKKLAAGDARNKAFDAAAGDADTIREGTTIETIASEREIEIQTSPAVSRGGTIPGIGAAQKVIDAALALEDDAAASDPVGVGDTYYVVSVEERIDSYIPELADVRDPVVEGYRKEQSTALAGERADALVEELKAGKTLAAAAEASGYTVEETSRPFNRRGAFVPGVGNVPGVKQIAFTAIEVGTVLPRSFTHREDAYVFVIKSREAADLEAFEKEKDDRIAAIRSRKEAAAVSEFVRQLKQDSNVSYDDKIINAYMEQR